ncbi:hypothetical protein BGC_10680 [Burkholderia sp. 3C]
MGMCAVIVRAVVVRVAMCAVVVRMAMCAVAVAIVASAAMRVAALAAPLRSMVMVLLTLAMIAVRVPTIVAKPPRLYRRVVLLHPADRQLRLRVITRTRIIMAVIVRAAAGWRRCVVGAVRVVSAI